jgi:hypothetical protein
VAQIFHRSFNTLSKVSVFGALLILAFLGWVLYVWSSSSYATNARIAREQPVPFSHEHHVSGLGIDCRYCHESADKSSFAGMPPTKTCMNCHEQIWTGSDMLGPVRESYRKGEPIKWVRVYRLADFAYFDHSVHVNKGVGCASCHGPVQQMPLTYQYGSLLMEWCLDCHRKPEDHLRPRSKVYDMEFEPSQETDENGKPFDQATLGAKLKQEYDVHSLTTCSTCHR